MHADGLPHTTFDAVARNCFAKSARTCKAEAGWQVWLFRRPAKSNKEATRNANACLVSGPKFGRPGNAVCFW